MATSLSDKIHFDLAMSPSANSEIETLAKAIGIEPGEIVARAVTMFISIQKARKADQTIGLLDANKKPVVEFAGI